MRSRAPKTTAPHALRPLHVVLEHRDSKRLKSYLQFLEKKRLQNNLPTKLSIFSDFQWIQNGQVISVQQRQQLFQALGEICGNTRHLQIDLLCDLFLPDVELSLDFDMSNYGSKHNNHGDEDNSTTLTEDASSSSTDTASSSRDEEAADLVQRLQVLPCSLITCLIKNAPLLETLTLKELFLSGSAEEVMELVSCLESHPTLQQVDLRWKLAGSNKKNSRILDPIVQGLANMPQLEQLNLMIPHWCPALELLPQSSSLKTVKLTVENIPEPTSASNLLRHWKHNTSLQHLEVSSFQILQDSSALLELIGHNTQLQHLVVIDHNIFRSRKSSALAQQQQHAPKRTKSNSKQASNLFALELAQVLQTNTSLKHLHLISKSPRRRGSAYKTEQERAHHRQVLGDMMEHNFVLEHLEISHCGVQISSPKQPQNSAGASKNGTCCLADNFLDSPHILQRATCAAPSPEEDDDKLDFYLRLNQDGYRRKLLLQGDCEWHQAVQHYQMDTASLFSLIQAAPSVVDTMLVR